MRVLLWRREYLKMSSLQLTSHSDPLAAQPPSSSLSSASRISLVMYALPQKAFILLLLSTGDLSPFLSFLYLPAIHRAASDVPSTASSSPSAWAAPGWCEQDGGDLEIILSYVWLQLWECNLQIPVSGGESSSHYSLSSCSGRRREGEGDDNKRR